jgi:hypothetical protein
MVGGAGVGHPRVFLSYRREDAPGSAGRLFDALSEVFASEHVFMDVDTVDPGQDFEEAITQAVLASDVLLAVIGPRWTTALDAHQPAGADDFVRIEIASALSNGIRTVPVLVEGGQMPRPRDLPSDLQPLARRNAISLSSERWRRDIIDVIAAVEASNPGGAPSRPAMGELDPETRATEPSAEPVLVNPATEPAFQRRRPRRWGIAVAAVGVLFAVGLATLSLYQREDGASFDVLLRSHMPASLEQTCTEAPVGSSAVVAQLDCAQPPLDPSYQLFSDRDAMRDAFRAITAPLVETLQPPACDTAEPSSGVYASDRGSGALACFRGRSDGLAYIVWTVDDLNVLGVAHADSPAVGIPRIFSWFQAQEGVWELRE